MLFSESCTTGYALTFLPRYRVAAPASLKCHLFPTPNIPSLSATGSDALFPSSCESVELFGGFGGCLLLEQFECGPLKKLWVDFQNHIIRKSHKVLSRQKRHKDSNVITHNHKTSCDGIVLMVQNSPWVYARFYQLLNLELVRDDTSLLHIFV